MITHKKKYHLDWDGGGDSGLLHGVAKESDAGDSRGDGTHDPSVDGSLGLFHEVRVVAGELGLVGLAVDTLVVGTGLVDLLATEVEGDDGLERVLDDDGAAGGVLALADGVARLVRGGVSEDVRAGGLDVEGAGALGGAGAVDVVGAGGAEVGVREGSLADDLLGLLATVELAGRASGVLDDDGAGKRVGSVAGGVLALVGDLVGADLGEVDNVTGDLDLLGDDIVDLVGASGAIIDVVLVVGGLDGHEVVAKDVKDRLGVVLVDDGAALGDGVTVLVSAVVLDEVGSRLEGVEGDLGALAGASVHGGLGGGRGALVGAGGALLGLHEVGDDLDVLGVASGVLDDVVVEAALALLEVHVVVLLVLASLDLHGAVALLVVVGDLSTLVGEALPGVGAAGAHLEDGLEGVANGDLAGLLGGGEALEVLAVVLDGVDADLHVVDGVGGEDLLAETLVLAVLADSRVVGVGHGGALVLVAEGALDNLVVSDAGDDRLGGVANGDLDDLLGGPVALAVLAEGLGEVMSLVAALGSAESVKVDGLAVVGGLDVEVNVVSDGGLGVLVPGALLVANGFKLLGVVSKGDFGGCVVLEDHGEDNLLGVVAGGILGVVLDDGFGAHVVVDEPGGAGRLGAGLLLAGALEAELDLLVGSRLGSGEEGLGGDGEGAIVVVVGLGDRERAVLLGVGVASLAHVDLGGVSLGEGLAGVVRAVGGGPNGLEASTLEVEGDDGGGGGGAGNESESDLHGREGK